jgi:hypothetical protein
MAEIHGLKIPDLPDDGSIPLRVIAIIEMLDKDGNRKLLMAATDDIMPFEGAGMATWLDQRCREMMSGRGS